MSEKNISNITTDSRKVVLGSFFVAIKGLNADGFDFIETALKSGASKIMVQKDISENQKAQLKEYHNQYNFEEVVSDNIRRDLSRVCAEFYGKQPEYITAVTGTDGKTSTAEFQRQIFDALNIKSASIGTIGVLSKYVDIKSSHTTPPPEDLYRILSEMDDAGIKAVAMEASSQGIAQERLTDVKIKSAGFTTFSEEHMQEHGSMENYLKEKSRLFAEILDPTGMACLNADIPEFEKLKSICEARGIKVISYGENGTELKLIHQELTDDGQIITIEFFGKKYVIGLDLIGQFQAMNILCAVGIVLGALYSEQIKKNDTDFLYELMEEKELVSIISGLKTVNGRMDFVAKTKQGASIFIDYAHTGDAVEKVLKTLRPHTKGKLICVFGCGGNRDASKRITMGRAAENFSDVAIITDDNPRNEDPANIRAQVQTACPSGLNIGDRKTAIEKAIKLGATGDIIVVAGKGHETGQIIKGEVIPYSDRETIKGIVEND